MTMEYDTSLESLIHPGTRPTVFTAGAQPSLQGLACEAARLAYLQAETNLAERARLDDALDRVGFEPSSCLFDVRTGGYAYCSRRKSGGLALIAFRGTEPGDLRDFMTDLQVVPAPWRGVLVHAGFLAGAQALGPAGKDWVGRHRTPDDGLLLCGHSLGAALATLFALMVDATKVITIGSPRVGDAAFSAALPAGVVTRIANCADVVTALPPELAVYTHAGQLLYIDKVAALHAAPDPFFMLKDQAQAQAEFAWRNLGAAPLGLAPARALLDHSPINYARAFFA